MNEEIIKELKAEIQGREDEIEQQEADIQDLKDEIKELEAQEKSKDSRVPGREDVGRWVKVWDSNDEKWKGPRILAGVCDHPTTPYKVSSYWWGQARIVPGVGRVTMLPHDGSDAKPEWLNNGDLVLVETKGPQYAMLVMPAHKFQWRYVVRYQKLEIK